MAKQKGGNRGLLISFAVVVIVTGIVIGVLFATGVLGKKTGGGSPTRIPVTPGSKSSIPGYINKEFEILDIVQSPSPNVSNIRLQVDFKYVSNDTLNNATANITTAFPGSGSKTLTGNTALITGEGEIYTAQFDIDASSLPGGSYYGANMTITSDSGLTSIPFSFNFSY
jgi:hypothetical protein